MKLEQHKDENGATQMKILGTNISVEWINEDGEDLFRANFDNCIAEEEDMFNLYYKYSDEYIDDSKDVLEEIKHYMEWFIGAFRNSISLAEIRTSYMLALDGKV